MVLEGITLSEIKSDKERHILYVLTYRRSLKKKKKKSSKIQRKTDGFQRQGVGEGKMDEGGLKGTSFLL